MLSFVLSLTISRNLTFSLYAASLDLDATNLPEPMYYFLIHVHDNGVEIQHSVNITVYARVVRVNEYAPVLKHPAEITMELSTTKQINNSIIHINATDADNGPDGDISYSISQGNANGVFGINQNTGKILHIRTLF